MAGPDHGTVLPRFRFAAGFQKVIHGVGNGVGISKPHFTEKLKHPCGLGRGARTLSPPAVVVVGQRRFAETAIGILKAHQLSGGLEEIG